MNTVKLLQENPKVKAALHEWMFNKLTKSFKDFDKDEAFKDYMMAKGVSEKQIMTTMIDNPRSCFDLLDSHDIIVTVKYNRDSWTNNYYPSEDDKTYESRLNCERAGLELGIIKLEKLLNSK
jgi:hypothetical protein